MLPGFERYTASAYTAAESLGARPARQSPAFTAPYKRAQRAAVALAGIAVQQPRHILLDSLEDLTPSLDCGLTFPVVVKPGNGGGGLGVLLVSQPGALTEAAQLLREVTNYGGSTFDDWLIEEFVEGTEVSVQGVAREGNVQILTYCEKVITVETEQDSLISSFRESGHIAYPGDEADAALQAFAQGCISAVGYQTGPFHVDLIRDGDSLLLLEMGFRLSGMRVTELVTLASGYDWGEEAFRSHLGEPASPRQPAPHLRYAGHFTMRHPEELDAARRLMSESDSRVTVQPFGPLPDLAHGDGEWPASLHADITRHAGAVGRVLVQASNPRLVAMQLEHCKAGMRVSQP